MLAVKLSPVLVRPRENSDLSPVIEDVGVPDNELSLEQVSSAPELGGMSAGEWVNRNFGEMFCLIPSTLNLNCSFLETEVEGFSSVIFSSILGGYKVISLTARCLFFSG